MLIGDEKMLGEDEKMLGGRLPVQVACVCVCVCVCVCACRILFPSFDLFFRDFTLVECISFCTHDVLILSILVITSRGCIPFSSPMSTLAVARIRSRKVLHLFVLATPAQAISTASPLGSSHLVTALYPVSKKLAYGTRFRRSCSYVVGGGGSME